MPMVVLDLDGTLTQTVGVDDRCFVRAIDEALGLSGRYPTDWSTYEHVTDTGLINEIVRRAMRREATPIDHERVRERFLELLREQAASTAGAFRATPGAPELLARLASDNRFGVAIATGAWRASAALKARAADLDLTPFPLACADDAQSRADIVLLAISRSLAQLHRQTTHQRRGCAVRNRSVLSSARERLGTVVIVGDAVWDARCARSLGINFVGLRADGDDRALRAQGATCVLRDFRDTDAAIDALCRASLVEPPATPETLRTAGEPLLRPGPLHPLVPIRAANTQHTRADERSA
jgi:phosphoglycolate phosphatase-like HAD superfamily hydrolase